MSADFDFFRRIPYEQYLQKRDDIDSRIKLSDLENGMIVDAFSANRHLGREGAAVSFIAELRLDDSTVPHMGAIGLNLVIYSHTTLQPIRGAEFPIKAYVETHDNEPEPISWQMSGRFPLRTARYGVIQAGFFSYWADSFIAELETDTTPPQIEN